MIRIIRASKLKRLQRILNIREWELEAARLENERLFNLLNERQSRPKPDKSGKLRNPDGTFARVK